MPKRAKNDILGKAMDRATKDAQKRIDKAGGANRKPAKKQGR